MVCGVALKEALGDSADLWEAGRMGAAQLSGLARHENYGRQKLREKITGDRNDQFFACGVMTKGRASNQTLCLLFLPRLGSSPP